MPRVKRTRKRTATGDASSPVWYSYAHSLTDEACAEICALLGFDHPTGADAERQNAAIARVKHWLGWYRGAVGAIDNAPRPANYRACISPLRGEACTLLARIGGLDTWMRDALEIELKEAHQQDALSPDCLYPIERALAALATAAADAVKTYGRDESRGAPERAALRKLVAELRAVFAGARGKDRAERVSVGAQSNLTEYENDEIDFLRVALNDAGIPLPKRLRSLFAEPASAPTSKRGGKRR